MYILSNYNVQCAENEAMDMNSQRHNPIKAMHPVYRTMYIKSPYYATPRNKIKEKKINRFTFYYISTRRWSSQNIPVARLNCVVRCSMHVSPFASCVLYVYHLLHVLNLHAIVNSLLSPLHITFSFRFCWLCCCVLHALSRLPLLLSLQHNQFDSVMDGWRMEGGRLLVLYNKMLIDSSKLLTKM